MNQKENRKEKLIQKKIKKVIQRELGKFLECLKKKIYLREGFGKKKKLKKSGKSLKRK